jgi:protein-disulfide isomerase
MSTPPKPTKADRKEQARATREQAETDAAASAARRRRVLQLLGVLAVAAAVVVIAIVASSSGGGDTKKPTPAAAKQTATSLFAGIPQQGVYLGRKDAPVQVVSFVDLQCPYCREYEQQSLPTLIQKYVRTGKVRMELRTLSFLGADSVTAARAAAGAAQQNKLWTFANYLYANQGEENTGWITPALLTSAYKAAGVDAAKANAYAQTQASQGPLGAANSLASKLGVDSTPTVLVGKAGGSVKAINVDPVDTAGYEKAIDAVVGASA